MINKKELSEMINKIFPQAVRDRRYLHMHPELSFEEYNTVDYIQKRLDKLKIPYKKGIAGTGIVAEINGAERGKCLLLRADMDALPIKENTNAEYKSQNDGIMHACGHDVHTAILLNTCEILNSIKDSLCGTIKCVFQPGEETTGGAEPMIADGILENPTVDAAIALHVEPELTAGKIRIKDGALYASPDNFYITIKGKGAHGAEPHNSIDPTVIAAELIMQLQTIVSRDLNPFEPAVVTVGSVHGGDAPNVIPDTVKISGTARSFAPQTRNLLEKRIGALAESICKAHGADYEYEFERLYPPLINDKNIAELLIKSAIVSIGAENCVCGGESTMAGEDFAYFCEKVPATLFKLGCASPQKSDATAIHNSLFDVDENCIQCGITVFSDFVLQFLA